MPPLIFPMGGVLFLCVTVWSPQQQHVCPFLSTFTRCTGCMCNADVMYARECPQMLNVYVYVYVHQLFPSMHVAMESLESHSSGTRWLRWWIVTMTVLQVGAPACACAGALDR